MTTQPIRAGDAVSPEEFDAIRRQLCLEHCKWDPQVGDGGTLANFPLLISNQTWQQLSDWAESLAADLLAMERQLIHMPRLQRRIGLPRRLRGAMQRSENFPRIVRFDFHFTSDGWKISECNADVPGGFNEASPLSALMSLHAPRTRVTGNPRSEWAKAVMDANTEVEGVIALVSAPGFMEDAQVIAGLAKELADRGIDAAMCSPRNLVWRGLSQAELWNQPVRSIVRFVQAEWLPALTPDWKLWWKTTLPVLNPPTAAIAESKRLPLIWGDLSSPINAWRSLLPETADPRDMQWKSADWIVKPAFGNTGDDVACIDWTPAKDWQRIQRRVWWHPREWVVQRRFEVVPLDTPMGKVLPCIGVFVIGGIVAGAYGRLAVGPIVDYRAIDAAVLVEAERDGPNREDIS